MSIGMKSRNIINLHAKVKLYNVIMLDERNMAYL